MGLSEANGMTADIGVFGPKLLNVFLLVFLLYQQKAVKNARVMSAREGLCTRNGLKL